MTVPLIPMGIPITLQLFWYTYTNMNVSCWISGDPVDDSSFPVSTSCSLQKVAVGTSCT